MWWLKPRNERAPITLCFDEDEWHDALATYVDPVNNTSVVPAVQNTTVTTVTQKQATSQAGGEAVNARYRVDAASIPKLPKNKDLMGTPFDQWKDCLLYTSPSPRDLSTSRMPSSA